ncbi:DUF3604 domain-containing protein [Marinigracilibium pacificum]|uniref:DUF3604 domain-containing protein n=1 Tax=Marinigracilibium pacificum TaxID=2729599 RepID=A0A848IX99_9BACT|nr:DUF3604 domain-containing protein [Marinigracilibium pacificum]NMM48276.1 DUF3604 domain-containing protein [Marinigracilibium pacificum]
MKPISYYLIVMSFIIMTSCSGNKESEETAQTTEEATVANEIKSNPLKDAYFGNVHIHTSYSFDGYTNKCPTNPEDAYRWAKGEAIPGGGGGGDLQINEPLDFYAVSDHAEWMGMFKQMENPESPLSKLDFAKRVTSEDPAVSFQAFADFLYDFSTGGELSKEPLFSDPEIMKSVWAEIVKTADEHYEPGKFTTFPAFEWSSNPNTRNLHRVVVFENSENIPDLAFSTNDSDKPEDLWKWMEGCRANGATLLAIPHNANASDGLMFSLRDSEGNPLSMAYSEMRMKNEPLYEISQIKGTSEVHPDLSPNDEFAGFELWDYTLAATAERPTNRKGSYFRQALLDGIEIEKNGNGNPFKYGVIGDSDGHNSAASVEEDNYTGKFATENSPAHRINGPEGFSEKNKQQLREFSSGGLAGVWAESNTREAIFEAMMRKETFGTSGTRMKVRLFGGYDFPDNLFENTNWVKSAYEGGIPMGSTLPASQGKAPTLVIHAIKDANGANLDRIQVIKGWVDKNGKQMEKIYNVVVSDDRTIDSNGSVDPVGNTVNVAEASYSNSIGDPELKTVWTDPDFDPSLSAFYYVRVLEIPTPRWSTYDAKTLGIEPRDDLPVTIQERGWSSPIWYTPSK